MTKAVGIHAHATRKLGRKPPSNKPALRLADFFDATQIPAHDPQDDNLGTLPFGLYENDRYGTCGPTSVANNVIQVTQGKVIPTLDDVIDLYKRSGNPNFPADDNGVVMQDMLDQLLKGGIGGRKPVAFAEVDHTNAQELEAAINIFDGCLLGVDLQVAQQTQSDGKPPVWDYKTPHSEWGGHAILGGEYDPNADVTVISWTEHIATTEAFRSHQLDEVWVVVWPEHLTRPGVNVAALQSAFKALTGRDLPIPSPSPVPPSPEPVPPAPDPSPVPSGCFLIGPVSEHRQALLARHAKAHGFAAVDAYLTARIEHGSY